MLEYYIPKTLQIHKAVSSASNESVPFPVQPELRMYDVYGRWAQHLGSEGSEWTVTASLVPGIGDPNAKLDGETTVAFINGTASFKDLQITHAGNGYQLQYRVSFPTTVSFEVTGTTLINIGYRDLSFRFETNIVSAVEMSPVSPPLKVFVRDVATGTDVTSLGSKGEDWIAEARLVTSNNAELVGTTKVKFNATMGIFEDLAVSKAGNGYQIILNAYTDPASQYVSNSHATNTFSVDERSYHLALTREPSDCNETVPCGKQPVVEVRSDDGLVAEKLNWDNKQWHVEASLCQGDAVNNPMKGVTKLPVPESGVVNFTGLYFEKEANNYKMCFQLVVTPSESKYDDIRVESQTFSIQKRLFYLKLKVQPGIHIIFTE